MTSDTHHSIDHFDMKKNYGQSAFYKNATWTERILRSNDR